MTTKTITVKEASFAINQLATNFMESSEIDADLLSILTHSITNETTMHLRDYILGMPIDFGVEFMINFAEAIEVQTPAEKSYAIKTILSAFYFENLNTNDAKAKVQEALDIEPKYALALLLSRVYGSGWSAESFVKMRKELHPKVIVMIKEDATKEI
jgi:hypothetical protein